MILVPVGMSQVWKSWIIRYGAALVCFSLALWMRFALHSFVGDRVPFITFLIAVAITAFVGGAGPALLVVVLSTLAAAQWFLSPEGTMLPTSVADWSSLTVFVAIGSALAAFGSQARRERDAAEEAARTARADRRRFEVTLASIADGVIVTDENATITFMNGAAEMLTGWDLAAAAGRPLEQVFRLIDEQTREPVSVPIGGAIEERRPKEISDRAVLVARGGAERHVADSVAPILNADRTPGGAILVFRDITEARRIERERRRAAALVEFSEDAIVGQTLDGIVTDWNAAAERLFGFTAEEAVGRPITETIVPEDRWDELAAVLERVRAGERVEPFETVRRVRDGSRIEVSIGLSPVRSASGEIIGASVIDRDVTWSREVERRRSARLAVTQILAQERNAERGVGQILKEFTQALRWNAGAFWRFDQETNALSCAQFWHQNPKVTAAFEDASRDCAFRSHESLPGRVWASREPRWIEDVTADKGFVRKKVAAECGLHGAFACPVAVGDDFIGVLEFFSRSIREPDPDLLEMAGTLGLQIGDYIGRRRDEERLRFQALLLDSFGQAAIATGRDGRVIYANRFAETLYGWSRDEMVGRSLSEMIGLPETAEEGARIMKRVWGGQPWAGEFRVRSREGRVFDVAVNLTPIRERDGEVTSVIGISSDVTDRKREEEAIRFLAAAGESLAGLVDYRSTLQRIAQLAVPDFADWCAVDMIDDNGALERVAVAHADPEKIKLAEELNRRFPPLLEDSMGVGRVASTGEPELVEDITGEMLQTAARSPEHLRILSTLDLGSYICVPLRIQNEPAGAITFLTSSSSRRYTRHDLSMALDLVRRAGIAIENARLYHEVREADRRKDEFLAMLAHELRNPLAPIRTGLELLALKSSGQDPTVTLMQEQVDHLVRLVDDLLDVSRIIRGRVDLRMERLDLRSQLQRAIASVEPLARTRELKFSRQIPPAPLEVVADPVRLAQIFENLIHNAAKYTDPGGEIHVRAETKDGAAVVSVRDTGVGIDQDLLPQIFDLFTQATRSLDRSQGGLGIGLTLVRNLVELHGGEVSVDSAGPGQGSEFRVRIPLAGAKDEGPDAPAPPNGAARADASEGTRREISPRRILVVDDNTGAAQLLSMLITELGAHEVAIAADGPAALARADEFRPDIVLLDIGLPGIDGFQVARTLRARPKHAHILLVALTGYGQQRDRNMSREAGFDEHIVKPPALDDIRRVLSHPKLK